MLEGLDKVGVVDLIFFWPTGHEATPADRVWGEKQVRERWRVSGQVRFVRAGRDRNLLDAIGDAVWAIRGAVGFFESRPSMRTSGRLPVLALRKALRELQPDLILAHRIGPASALRRVGGSLPPIVLDVDDLEHVKLSRMAASQTSSREKLISKAWAAIAKYSIRQAGKVATRMLVTSDLDRSKLQAFSQAPVSVLPNSAKTFAPSKMEVPTEPLALFVGTFAYPPNVEGVKWLLAHVWPRILKAVPNAQLRIVGAESEKLGAKEMDGVEILGFVPDLAPIYQTSSFAVCPIHRGAGTRIKIIEAAMNGLPTVATHIGAEGLEFVEDEEILLASDTTRFAEACVMMFLDRDSVMRVGNAARRKAFSVYDPRIVATKLADICFEVMKVADDHDSIRRRSGSAWNT
jgi:glycosyltransferase involved in cell wall biosynthesis